MQFIKGKKILFFIALPACAAGIFLLGNIGWFFFFNPFIPDSRVSIHRESDPANTLPYCDESADDDPTLQQPIETAEALEKEFNRFLEIKGVAGNDPLPEAGAGQETLSYGDEAKESFVQQVIDTIPQVSSVRVQNEGEVWMQLQPDFTFREGAQVITESAARLYQETLMTDQPVKIVVWRGNKAALVQTFFGPPVF
ncbi:MAG: hypothetical protein JEZ12_25665 [Desulfobacterium sp.]|nr:hypothetical protein [Desulfobacterium sp.]